MTSNCPLQHLLGALQLHEVSRLAVPQETCYALTPSCHWELVENHIPFHKACLPAPPYFPQGSIIDPSILIQPASPTTPFKFSVDMPPTLPTMDVGEAFHQGTAMDSVTRVVGLPQVYGLKGDEGLFVCIMRAAVGWDVFDNPSLMDGGANICITGILGLLLDIVSIPPLPISVATTSGSFLLDDCCTNQGSFR
jgi:hypothetical protein